jgi:D-threo-aldose 1-dehydrogenase
LALGAKRYQESGVGGAVAAEEIEQVEHLELVCSRFNVPLEAAALQFPAYHPAVTGVLVGSASAEQVREAIAAFEYPVSGEFWEQLKAKSLIGPSAPVPNR